jgi:hypothetical protein
MSDSAEVTFDIVVSGCATKCWHCYVCGSPAPAMALRDCERVLAFVDEIHVMWLDTYLAS